MNSTVWAVVFVAVFGPGAAAGAGGIGVVLNGAVDVFQRDRVAAKPPAIIAVVLRAEVLVNRIRARLIWPCAMPSSSSSAAA